MCSDADTAATDRDRAAALSLVEEAVVMTLAVSTDDGPWAAPVYYVFLPADAGFYFFSSPESRHVTAGLETGGCSAAIFRPADGWKDICGLQMRGQLTPATKVNTVRAFARYLKKFPFSRDLLPGGSAGLEAFRDRLGVGFFCFRADHIEWTDNRVHFGYRRRLTL